MSDCLDSPGSRSSSSGGPSRTDSSRGQSRTSSSGGPALWKHLTESDYAHYVNAQEGVRNTHHFSRSSALNTRIQVPITVLLIYVQDYQTALSELRGGRKQSHWIWYIMPMMSGIGYSHMCQTYGVPSLDHATGYLLHPILGPRLAEVVEVVHSQICERNLKLQRLMGSDVDALKAVSCLVLFRAAAEPLASADVPVPFDVSKFRDRAKLVLDAVSASYPACKFTTDYLKRQQTGKHEAANHDDD
jgi:uncharacterized protein (DUF1810 family)